MSLYSEISMLDELARHAYRDLIGHSGYTEEDFDQVCRQGTEAFRNITTRYPDKLW